MINIDETDLKQPNIQRKIQTKPMDFKNLREKIHEPKVSRLLPNLCDFHTKKNSYPRVWNMDYKIYRKSIG
jgi:hypothetical protein